MHEITNIQKYSIYDGDGIRTTVFFKGCPLRCQCCHNPETQRYEAELSVDTKKCTGCGRCAVRCPNGAIAIVDGKAQTDRTSGRNDRIQTVREGDSAPRHRPRTALLS